MEKTPTAALAATKRRTTTTVMAPSGPLFSSRESSISSSFGAAAAANVFEVHPEEPNLYLIPPKLHPIYRPLPVLLRLCIGFLASLISAGITWKNPRLIWVSPLVSLATGDWNIKKLSSFLVKALALSVLSKTLLQEVLVPPSRISTVDLMKQFVLPSTLSRYERLQLPSTTHQKEELGVHYLQHESSSSKPPRFQAIYVNHGFGASSLSWLPALTSLVDRLETRVGLGHDAVGFGFTDRPPTNNLERYTPQGSSEIGTALLQGAMQNNDTQPVILMGHSMGCLTTLRMALALPKTTRKWVILVCPALGMSPGGRKQPTTSKILSFVKQLKKPGIQVSSAVGRYSLRRLVGGEKFWRRGLEMAWGDAKKLKDSDVLRFQWPSIGKGWEDGLLTFSSAAMTQPTSISDNQLLEEVLKEETNATVTIILSSRDKVVQSKRIRSFLQSYRKQVRIVEMEGTGHDPFEEDVAGFLETLEQVLEKDKGIILGDEVN